MSRRILVSFVTLMVLALLASAQVGVTFADGPQDKQPDPSKAYQSVAPDGTTQDPVNLKGPRVQSVEGFQPSGITQHRPDEESGLEFARRAVKGMLKPDTVFGTDDRVRISPASSYPWSAIAHLVIARADGQTGTCTGFFIGPHTVATAGHCVYNGGWARSIQVIPGRDGASAPFGSQTVGTSNLRTVTGWIQFGTPLYDYGVIIMPDDTMGNRVGWFGFANFDDSTIMNLTGNLSGYPSDKPFGTQWWDAKGMIGVDADQVYYLIDMIPGHSGSPVWRTVNNQRYAFAINTYQTNQYNFGKRINQTVFNLLLNWRQ